MTWLISVGRRLLLMRRRWLGLLAGCVFWLAWMIFGFLDTILLIVLAAIGFAVGRILEERSTWQKVVERLLTENNHDA